MRPAPNSDPYYRQQAWYLLQVNPSVCLAGVRPTLLSCVQAYIVSVMNLSDADSDLYQLLKQVTYQPSELSASRLKHISLPQCTNKVARTTFETALNGVFSEFSRGAVLL